jgi:hypothetical protein
MMCERSLSPARGIQLNGSVDHVSIDVHQRTATHYCDKAMFMARARRTEGNVRREVMQVPKLAQIKLGEWFVIARRYPAIDDHPWRRPLIQREKCS